MAYTDCGKKRAREDDRVTPIGLHGRGLPRDPLDIGLSKRSGLGGRSSFEVAIEVLNVMDTINFSAVANPGSASTIFQTTGIYMDQNNTYDPGGRLGQLMFRVNW